MVRNSSRKIPPSMSVARLKYIGAHVGKRSAASGQHQAGTACMLGWKTRSFPDLELVHHRVTGAADGTWANLVKNGRADYICGYHPLFMLSKCLVRLPLKPSLLGSFALFYGYASGYFKGIPQVDDRRTIEYLRRQQINRLLGQT